MPDRVPADPVIGPNANIARHLARMAAAHAGAPALKIPRGRTSNGDIDYLTLSFAELDAEVAGWSNRLLRAGIRQGDRTLVMVRQGLPLIASVFALFRSGAVPVVIDPGMGLKSFLACVARSRPRAVVGVPLALLISRMFRRSFSSVAVRVAAGGSLTARVPHHPRDAFIRPDEARSGATDLAAVLFTSGSTGAPKGVCYEHGMFDAQVHALRESYGIEPGEIDLPLLPIFALFNPALGMTTIVPEIDPRRPAALDPAKIVQAIRQENVTNSFGSPTLWGKIAAHCRSRGMSLPSLRRVLCAGAAVPATLWENSRTLLPNGMLHSPYGATEALPIATISSAEIEPFSLRGACVGRLVGDVEVKIIAIVDGPIPTLSDARELPAGEIGEIIVRGPVVTKIYDAMPDATLAAKILDGGNENPDSPGAGSRIASNGISTSSVWHRMGDCGFRGIDGRLWFCGRKSERVQTASGTLHTEPCEQVFRQHPRAARCALVGIGEPGCQTPALIVETRVKDVNEARTLARELRALAMRHAHTSGIARFHFRARFPVDVRHNAKIHRLALANWARNAKAFEPEPDATAGRSDK